MLVGFGRWRADLEFSSIDVGASEATEAALNVLPLMLFYVLSEVSAGQRVAARELLKVRCQSSRDRRTSRLDTFSGEREISSGLSDVYTRGPSREGEGEKEPVITLAVGHRCRPRRFGRNRPIPDPER